MSNFMLFHIISCNVSCAVRRIVCRVVWCFVCHHFFIKYVSCAYKKIYISVCSLAAVCSFRSLIAFLIPLLPFTPAVRASLPLLRRFGPPLSSGGSPSLLRVGRRTVGAEGGAPHRGVFCMKSDDDLK